MKRRERFKDDVTSKWKGEILKKIGLEMGNISWNGIPESFWTFSLYKINMILTNCKLYLKSSLNPKFSMLYLYTNVVTHLYTIF